MTIPDEMAGVLLTGHGGLEKLQYRTDIAVPKPDSSEVLIRVAASGVNNTDINTRTGWYSKSVESGTEDGGSDGFATANHADGSWSGEALIFPRIQGADICGYIVEVGDGVEQSRIGQRVLVRSMQSASDDPDSFECITIGSEFDGGFAQFAVARSSQTYAVESPLSDVELASFPCAYSTAENMLHRAGIGAETILISGASGGVGSAAVQLAKRRGATVIAISSAGKAENVMALGADRVVERNANLLEVLGEGSIDTVVDLVAGDSWPDFLKVLRRGGRYVTAGAIAGPLAEIDIRTLYLKDLTLYGCTFQDDIVFENLITYIEKGEIQPVVAKTYPLSEIRQAQTEFLKKKFTGKLVLIPPVPST